MKSIQNTLVLLQDFPMKLAFDPSPCVQQIFRVKYEPEGKNGRVIFLTPPLNIMRDKANQIQGLRIV